MAKRMKNSFIWVSVLYVILGLILTIWPETSGLVICYIAAVSYTHLDVYKRQE